MPGPKVTMKMFGGRKAAAKLLQFDLNAHAVQGQLRVGVDARKRHPRTGTSYAQVYAINEFGLGVDARPAVTTVLTRNKRKYLNSLRSRLGIFMSPIRKSTGWKSSMQRFAKMMRNDIRKEIKAWDRPPNAAETINRKGFDDPLVETGGYADAFIFRWRGMATGNSSEAKVLAKAFRRLDRLGK